MKSWQLQDARRNFSRLFDDALSDGPQKVTRHGRKAVVVVSEADWDRLRAATPSLARLLAACPVEDGDLPERGPARAGDDPA